MKPFPITPEERRKVLAAISATVRRTFRYPSPPTLPLYPSAVPELDEHINQLVGIIRESESPDRAAHVVSRTCPVCPHQFPSRYCPLRPRGGCVLNRCAGPIVEAIAQVLECETPQKQETCHAEDAS